MTALRVLCVDDERCFGDAFRLAIDLQPDLACVGIAHTVAEALVAVDDLAPDVVVMDVCLPDGSGIDATRRIKDGHDLRVIVLTGHADVRSLVDASVAGADGFLPKDAELDDVLAAIRRIDSGIRLDATNVSVVSPHPEPGEPGLSLTRREAEVLGLLASGLKAKVIARDLGISIQTCRGYIRTLLEKLHVHSQLEAVLAAERLGLVAPARS